MREQRRLPNPRRIKIHRNYTVEEAARQLGVHKNTIRQWIKSGLPTVDQQRPTLILGRDLSAFLTQHRKARKRPCQPGEIYCVRCRQPKSPAGDIADCQPRTPLGGTLVGICPSCNSKMYRHVSYLKLEQDRGKLAVRLPEAGEHIDESSKPSVNSDFNRD
jgi:hypothetical protein